MDEHNKSLKFPRGYKPREYPKPMTIEAIRLLVRDMLEFAAYSPDAYFEVGPIEERQDGTICFNFQGLEFSVTVEPSEDVE